jgi:dUTP pyrophosphatase
MRESPKAASFALRSANDAVVPASGKELILTDLQLELPRGCYGQIASRSGLALWDHIAVEGGEIDEDYRGSLNVMIFNHSENLLIFLEVIE